MRPDAACLGAVYFCDMDMFKGSKPLDSSFPQKINNPGNLRVENEAEELRGICREWQWQCAAVILHLMGPVQAGMAGAP